MAEKVALLKILSEAEERRLGLIAEWELRFGPGNRQVFYQTDMEHSKVLVLAIGVKKGNRLWIGEKEGHCILPLKFR